MPKLKKILLSVLLIFLISSCQNKLSQNKQSEEPIPQSSLEDSNQQAQDFKVIDDEAAAGEVNKQTEAAIEEIEVIDRVFFGLDSSSLSAEAKKVLDNQSAWLKSDNSIKIIVEGHCDERGTREYNIALGAKRAATVKNFLVKNGVASTRIKTISYGKERPAFVGSNEAIWSKNRRAVTAIQ